MAAEWPDHLSVILREGDSEGFGPSPRRTGLEDGRTDQAAATSRLHRVRTLQVLVTDDDATAWMTWIESVDGGWWRFPLWDRDVRLVGGAASVRLEKTAGTRLEGARYRRATIEIETR